MTNIEEGYKKVSKLFTQNEKMIILDIENSKFPKTFKGIFYKIKEIDSILDGLKNCLDNFYSSQILTRTLFEHFLIAHYLYLKWDLDKTDEIGIEFYRFYFCSEFFKRKTYSRQIENIKKGIKETITIDSIKESYPEFDFMQQQDLQEIHSKSRQFSDIKKIGEYLIKYGENKENLKTLHQYLLEFLDRYNILSSFTHGGPKAEQDTFYPNSELKENNGVSSPLENIQWAQIASKTCKTFLILSLWTQYPLKYAEISRKMTHWE